MKKLFGGIVIICLAIFLTVGVPYLLYYEPSLPTQNVGRFSQKALHAVVTLRQMTCIYENDSLLGVTTQEALHSFLTSVYKEKYENQFPDTHLSLGKDFTVSETYSFMTYENKDEEIFSYLKKKDSYAIEVTSVSFADNVDVYDRIYVRDSRDYDDALDEFKSLFISKGEQKILENGGYTTPLASYSSRAVRVQISQTVTKQKAYCNPAEVLLTKDAVLKYLKYGKTTIPAYDTIGEEESLEAFADRHGLSVRELKLINQISATPQPNTKLCVTYFTSPLTITVVYQTLTKVYTDPGLSYVVNEAIAKDGQSVLQTGVRGEQNVLYNETYINGVLIKGDVLSKYDITKKVDEIIAVKSDESEKIGTGLWVAPVDNMEILARYSTGISVIDKYERYGNVYAGDTGVIVESGFSDTLGNYVIIDHQNGYRSIYSHLYAVSPLAVDTRVIRGQTIGKIGTGIHNDGAKLVFQIEKEGELADVCDGFLPCE